MLLSTRFWQVRGETGGWVGLRVGGSNGSGTRGRNGNICRSSFSASSTRPTVRILMEKFVRSAENITILALCARMDHAGKRKSL